MASAHVIEFVAPAPVTTLLEPPVPVGHIVQVPQVQVVQKTTETPQLQIIAKFVETPEIRSVQGPQTSVSLGHAPIRPMKDADIVDVVEVNSPLPAKSAPLVCVAAHVVDVPPVALERAQPAPVINYVAPGPAVALAAAPAPLVEDIAPTPAVTYAAEQAPVVDIIAPVPDVTYTTLAPVIAHIAPAPAVIFAEPSPVVDCIGPTNTSLRRLP